MSIISVVLLWALFQFTKVGLAMRAAALRPAAASLVGVRVDRMLAVGWGLAAVLGAVAGLMTEPTQFLQPTMMQPILLYAFAAAVLGGLESPVGAVIGGMRSASSSTSSGSTWASRRRSSASRSRSRCCSSCCSSSPTGLFGRKQVRRV